MNGVIGNVWGMGKNFNVLQAGFFIHLKVKSNISVPDQKYLLYTSNNAIISAEK